MPEQPCAFHPDRLTRVSCSRCDRPICPDDMTPAPVGIHCPICSGRMRDGPLGATGYRVRARAERAPLVRAVAGSNMTQVLLGLNVLVMLFMLLAGGPTSAATLVKFGALITPLPTSQWWRLVTAMFVHIGLLHIMFNMFALVLFAGPIEHRYGRVRFLALYLGAGVLGSATSVAFTPVGQRGISAGASGAIFGIFGAFLALAIRHHTTPGMRGQIRSMVFFIGLQLYIGATSFGIDNRAHVGGLIGGLVIAFALELSALLNGPARTAMASLGYVIVALASYALVSARVI